MSAFGEAIRAAVATVREVAGDDIEYCFEGESSWRPMCATIGETSLKATTVEQVEIRKKWRDFIIDVLELRSGRRRTDPERLPKRGDLIKYQREDFIVANIPGGNCFEVEAQGAIFRIHATRQGVRT